MKTYEMFPCKKPRIMSDAEYERVNQENQNRIEMVFSQGYTLVSMIAVFWSFTVTALGISFERTELYSVCANMWQLFMFGGFLTVLFAVPVFLVMPFSVKYHDNLREICSLCTFLRVFYDLPSLLGKREKFIEDSKNNTKREYSECTAWESIHCEVDIPNAQIFSLEYKIIGILAVCLSFVMGVAVLTLLSCGVYHIREYHNLTNILWLVLFIIVFVALVALEIRFLCIVCKNTESKIWIRTYSELYTEKYLHDAIELEIIDMETYTKYMQWIKENAQNDCNLSAKCSSLFKRNKKRIKAE